jgi:hypothetical protein
MPAVPDQAVVAERIHSDVCKWDIHPEMARAGILVPKSRFGVIAKFATVSFCISMRVSQNISDFFAIMMEFVCGIDTNVCSSNLEGLWNRIG